MFASFLYLSVTVSYFVYGLISILHRNTCQERRQKKQICITLNVYYIPFTTYPTRSLDSGALFFDIFKHFPPFLLTFFFRCLFLYAETVCVSDSKLYEQSLWVQDCDWPTIRPAWRRFFRKL